MAGGLIFTFFKAFNRFYVVSVYNLIFCNFLIITYSL
ncbi:hypothetical protein T01_10790 [Trichinella spiralis]|uniref:Uncharacterized protein n=1 Tax=Trichinella spiralis TaxID=6334 RepID=A0A0V0Z070_TRISP|nr:hypothetical protein T01_10790 [Trichinella spiralis]